ncbi:uncharacterized protein EV420DRAFT_1027836 [Desarmillaria tabescens]|uniref:Uncharacterized protein n=1 Tax=Armillaria tabescens TaxID=1929756 RepID=A0AA39JIF4_ARMTA|nr:uncharacterized protein EV420DRAFT_1027836 [Desarmillaria tabescens]KAK0443365.1 hypothetical protein EV420DRAFT_1027836 [Desarmillaria tabescens]
MTATNLKWTKRNFLRYLLHLQYLLKPVLRYIFRSMPIFLIENHVQKVRTSRVEARRRVFGQENGGNMFRLVRKYTNILLGSLGPRTVTWSRWNPGGSLGHMYTSGNVLFEPRRGPSLYGLRVYRPFRESVDGLSLLLCNRHILTSLSIYAFVVELLPISLHFFQENTEISFRKALNQILQPYSHIRTHMRPQHCRQPSSWSSIPAPFLGRNFCLRTKILLPLRSSTEEERPLTFRH